MFILKIILVLSFGMIFYQDTKDREVYWLLFPLVWLCVSLLFYFKTITELFIMALIINLTFISLLLFVIFVYAKLKLKTNFYHAIGLGDVLFFYAVACSFSTISFLVIFICALIFSLVVHFIMEKETKSVPLAGYMSLFFGLIYIGFWTGLISSVYQI